MACSGCRVQQGKSFFQVERGEHTTEVGAQFDHGEGHVGIDTDDHRAGAAEIRHSGDVPQGPGAEGVEDVERGYVDDDSARPVAPHSVDQLVLEPEELAVVECGVDRGNEMGPLPEN